MKNIEKHWYSTRAPLWLLPASWLYCLLAIIRRCLYKVWLLPSYRVGVPVIVVGNINVGGTGKTPLVVWIVKFLKKAGYKPGIVTRGYGGQARHWPQQVRPDSDPVMVGDEPVLLARYCGCPVVAAPDRVQAARSLLKHADCDILVTDDGLQHYRLRRTLEVAVVDSDRRFGNGQCLPAGPLREPLYRLKNVDYIVANGFAARDEYSMQLTPAKVTSMTNELKSQSFSTFRNKKVHAIAGIGNPKRFFEMLKNQGLDVIEHPFPDHHQFVKSDLQFEDDLPMLMTEKDAVKCFRFADEKMWYVPVEAVLDEAFVYRFQQRIKSIMGEKPSGNSKIDG